MKSLEKSIIKSLNRYAEKGLLEFILLRNGVDTYSANNKYRIKAVVRSGNRYVAYTEDRTIGIDFNDILNALNNDLSNVYKAGYDTSIILSLAFTSWIAGYMLQVVE